MANEEKQAKREKRENGESRNGNGASHAPQTQAAPTAETFPDRIPKKIGGFVFDVDVVVRPGHVLSHKEAYFFNVARAAYIGSAYGDVLKANKAADRKDDEGHIIGPMSDEELRNHFAAYQAGYEWSPRGEGAGLDPVEAEIRKIAASQLTTALRAKNKTLQGLPKEVREGAIQKWIATYRTQLEVQAKRNLEEASALLSDDFLAGLEVRDLSASAPA